MSYYESHPSLDGDPPAASQIRASENADELVDGDLAVAIGIEAVEDALEFVHVFVLWYVMPDAIIFLFPSKIIMKTVDHDEMTKTKTIAKFGKILFRSYSFKGKIL